MFILGYNMKMFILYGGIDLWFGERINIWCGGGVYLGGFLQVWRERMSEFSAGVGILPSPTQ